MGTRAGRLFGEWRSAGRRKLWVRLFGPFALLGLWGCAEVAQPPASQNRFFNEPYVRRCLDLDRARQRSEAQTCWAELVDRLESDSDFRVALKLSSQDVARIRAELERSSDQSRALQKTRKRCQDGDPARRAERRRCLEEFLAAHRDELTVSERFEVEAAIGAADEAEQLAAGKVENTIERAGHLLGAAMHLEDAGIRIDAITGGPMAQAGVSAQGLIVALDGLPIATLDPAERIARLEACEERPVRLLLRSGDIGRIGYLEISVRCGKTAQAVVQRRVETEAETCSGSESPEIRLGLAWCHLAVEGALEVLEVCNGSPADRAGVQPHMRFTTLNGAPLLGTSYAEVAAKLRAGAITLGGGGALAQPAPIAGQLDLEQARRFFEAVRRQRILGANPR